MLHSRNANTTNFIEKILSIDLSTFNRKKEFILLF